MTNNENAYGQKEQKKLVAILFTDEKNFKDIIEIIEPESFENPALQLIVKVFIELYKKHNSKPDDEELGNEIEKAIKKDKRLPREEISKVLDDVFSITENPESLNYVREEFIELAKDQKIRDAISDGANLLIKKKPIDEIVDKMIDQFEKVKSVGNKNSSEELVVTTLSDVEAKDVDWLWDNRIPAGKLSLLVGDPGGGKSFFSLYMASRITGGGSWPDILNEEVRRGSVILLTAEDGLADTVRPRVDAMEGDVSRVYVIEGTREKGKLRTFSLAEDVARLESLIKEKKNVRAVIIDPMSAYMGSSGNKKIDSYRDTDIRSVLAPFKSLSDQYGVAIIGIMHLNKSTVLDAIYRVLGSVGFVGAARAVWLIVKDKEYSATRIRYFVPVKTNLSREPDSLGFTIMDNNTILFTGQTYNIDIQEQLSGKSTSQMQEAMDFLVKQFECVEADVISVKDVEEEAEEAGVAPATLRRAKKQMGVVSEKRKEGWVWLLPEKTVKPR